MSPSTLERTTRFQSSSRGFFSRSGWEKAVKATTMICAFVSIATTVGILVVLLSQSLPFFREASMSQFVSGTEWNPSKTPPAVGIWPLLLGTLMITIGAGLIAIPLGLLSAIYLSEYASPKVRGVLKPALELLAGIPTVVYGFFGFAFVTPLLKNIFPNIQNQNGLAGAIIVGIMILPLVSSLCEDAIRAVPRALREGAYGLGSTKFEVTMKVVVPAAFSGIMASFILALSRALGETMAVALAAGSTPNFTFNPTQSIETMTAYIVQTTKGDSAVGGFKYHSLFAVGITLFAFTLIMNLIAQRLVKRFRQVYA